MSGPEDPVLAELDALGIEHEVVPCDPELADTAAFCEHYGYAMDASANAIVVVGKGDPRRYVMCVGLANTRLDVNGLIRKRIGVRKASFASSAETVAQTGMTIGGVTPVGLGGRLPIWVDGAVFGPEQLIIGGGTRDRKILLPPSGLLEIPQLERVDDLARST